jgi:hypothetical protein
MNRLKKVRGIRPASDVDDVKELLSDRTLL